jgi:hypothetical protein
MEVDANTAGDTPMAEVTESQIEGETPRVTIDEPAEDQVALIDAGEPIVEDKMDTT